jgi:hypothetical protein
VNKDDTVKSIKGFDAALQCRGYQFKIGKRYAHKGVIKFCKNGFHACPVEHHPLSVFEYYPPAGSRFFEVTQSGKTSAYGNKLASAVITIDCEISIGDLVLRAWDYVWSRCIKADESHVIGDQGAASSTGKHGAASSTGYQGAASSTGYQGAASSTGNYGAASSTGYQGAASSTGNYGAASSTGDQGAASSTGNYGAASSTGDQGAASSTGYQGAASSTGYQGAASSTGKHGAASSTGYQGAASSTGNYGAASSTGYQGAASSTGYQGAAMACGYDGKVMGAMGNALFAVERCSKYSIVSVASGIVGQGGLEPHVWYKCVGGKLVIA